MTEKQLRRAGWNRTYSYMLAQKAKRKEQLAFCACCRVTWELVRLECNRAALEASEAYADGKIPLRTLKARWKAMRFEPAVYSQWFLGAAGAANGEFPNLSPDTDAEISAADAFKAVERLEKKNWTQAHLGYVLDVFGYDLNTYRFEREWATDTAVAVARQMYDARAFAAMPILADALQDAGCDCDTVLSHCRDATRAHCRGCWVVDLVLGK